MVQEPSRAPWSMTVYDTLDLVLFYLAFSFGKTEAFLFSFRFSFSLFFSSRCFPLRGEFWFLLTVAALDGVERWLYTLPKSSAPLHSIWMQWNGMLPLNCYIYRNLGKSGGVGNSCVHRQGEFNTPLDYREHSL